LGRRTVRRTQIVIETADAFGYIESFVNSLFTRNPGVIVKKGIRGGGDPKKAAALANSFLLNQREVIEDAARLALIYPMSFLKLSPRESDDPLRRISAVAVPPWEIILDRNARRFDEQKYMGHVYWCSLSDAREKFGDKKFDAMDMEDYFDNKERRKLMSVLKVTTYSDIFASMKSTICSTTSSTSGALSTSRARNG
jgi:hypothetical protein